MINNEFASPLFPQARLHAEPVSFQLDWGTLRGLRWGAADKPVILAGHGWLDNAHSFLPCAEVFLQSPLAHTHQLIAIDWAGHGLSDHRPAGNYYSFIDYVYDCWQLIEQENWQSVVLLAHSMGAFIANMLAGIAPDKVKAVLAIEAFGLLATPTAETAANLRSGFQSRWAMQNKRRNHYPSFAAGVAARAQAGDFSLDYAHLLVERGIEQVGPEDFCFRADGRLRMASPVRLTAEQISDVLRHIQCPFTLLYGTEGHERVHEALQLWRPAVPQLQVHALTGGHHVHMEQPNAVIAQLMTMIDGLND